MPIYINKPKTNKKSWNGWGRTNAYSYQKQMPYHLATFHLDETTSFDHTYPRV